MEAAKGHCIITNVLDKHGDLIIRLTAYDTNEGNPCSKTLLVDSRSMLRSLPPSANLILHARPCGQACNHRIIVIVGMIEITETMLNIIHTNFHMVPQSMGDLADLFRLVNMANRMGSIHLLRPWINTWLKDHRHWYDSWDWKKRTCLEDCQMRLFIAMRLGEKELVRHMANKYVRMATLAKESLALRILGEFPTGIAETFRKYCISLMLTTLEPDSIINTTLRQLLLDSQLCHRATARRLPTIARGMGSWPALPVHRPRL